MTPEYTHQIVAAIQAVAPIRGVEQVNADDPLSWKIVFDETATGDQRTAALSVLANPPSPRYQVPTALIVDRLIAAKLFDVANSTLDANPSQKARFYTRGYINSDNAEARDFIKAIGADPNQILAPE